MNCLIRRFRHTNPTRERGTALALACASGLFFACLSSAAEIATNSTGGGPWSDPNTWRGKKVPGPADDVVIQKFDIVIFDRDDDGKVSCQKLQIDPRGGLTFKTGAGKIVCSVADVLESFGAIKLDGTKSATDLLEIRFVGDKADKRKLKLMKGSALLLYGRDKLPEGHRNVILSSPKPPAEKDDVTGRVEAGTASMIDLLRVQVHSIKVQVKTIDNTGAKPNERLNVLECRFTGPARLSIFNCDSPVVTRNAFDCGTRPVAEAAIWVGSTPLAEIKDNAIRGPFTYGVVVNAQTDSVIVGNTIEKCATGFHANSAGNSMVKRCTIRGCDTGAYFHSSSGVLEELDIEGAKTAVDLINSRVQLTSVQVKDLAKGGVALLHESGSAQLLNCNILPKQIKLGPTPTPADKDATVLVTALAYVVVAVKNAPIDALVEVRTVKPPLPADAADPNVRNPHVPVVNGLTPLPRTLMPVIVKSWSLDLKGKVVPAPEYAVKVLGPAAKESDPRPVLKMHEFRPAQSLFRAMPNDPVPTLEVSAK